MSRRPPPSPPPPPRRRRTLLVLLIAIIGFVAIGITAGLVVITRLETGTWQVPDTDNLVRILKREPRTPARIIFLERRPIQLFPGVDDAPRGVSSVLANVRAKAATHTHGSGDAHDDKPSGTAQVPVDTERPAKLPGWKGSDKAWKQVVACVDKLFAPFDVKVTDARPTTKDDFVLVAVGGKPGDIGVTDKRVGGLAPFHGGVIARPVVYAFSAQLDHQVRAVCETIGMEVAHGYGLDHAYLCSDVMTYLPPCGAKKFVDKDVHCGEAKARNCEGGEPTQNSYRRLLQVLGPRKPAPPTPPAPSK